MARKAKGINREEPATVPAGEEKNKSQTTSMLNLPTIALLLITILSAYYLCITDKNTTTPINGTVTGEESPVATEEQSDNNKIYKNKDTVVDKNKEIVADVDKGKVVDKENDSTADKITNSYDKEISSYIYHGENLLNTGQYQECVSYLEEMMKTHSLSPRLVYGHAQCLNKLAEEKESNVLLRKAIKSYGEVANKPDVPEELLKISLMTQAKLQKYFGQKSDAIDTLKKLCKMLPSNVDALNELGFLYLRSGSNDLALKELKKALELDRDNGDTNIYIGAILNSQSKYKESIPYMLKGIRSGAKDAFRFYFQLGDAYIKTGQPNKAMEIFQEGAEKKIFPSAKQRSMHNAKSKLRAQPWWTAEETGYEKEIKLLEHHWETIRDEALAIIDKDTNEFQVEAENLVDQGDWRQFVLYRQARKRKQNCAKTPKTCSIIDKIQDATGNQRGHIKYSIMQPGTHVWPHTGPTNCRLRMHLGLVIPEDVHIRVGKETRTWENGKVIIIDDSFEHEVWHNGTKARLIFIVDFWHPDVPQWERETLSPL